MYRIAICDDNLEYRKTILNYLEQFKKETGCEPFHIQEFSDGQDLVWDYGAGFDIIFLDILMNRLDGMDTATKIREIDKEVYIVFITNTPEFALKGYEVQATNYLLKPLTYFDFSEQLKKLINLLNKRKTVSLIVKSEGGLGKVSSQNILFIETAVHKLIVHTIDGDYEMNDTIKNVETKLINSNFYRCNNCYLVNLARVKGVKDGLCKVGDYELIISRPRKKDFMTKFFEYLGEV